VTPTSSPKALLTPTTMEVNSKNKDTKVIEETLSSDEDFFVEDAPDKTPT